MESPGVKVRQDSTSLGGNLPYSFTVTGMITLRNALKRTPLILVFGIFLLFWLHMTNGETCSRYFKIGCWTSCRIRAQLTPARYFQYIYVIGGDGVAVRSFAFKRGSD